MAALGMQPTKGQRLYKNIRIEMPEIHHSYTENSEKGGSRAHRQAGGGVEMARGEVRRKNGKRVKKTTIS